MILYFIINTLLCFFSSTICASEKPFMAKAPSSLYRAFTDSNEDIQNFLSRVNNKRVTKSHTEKDLAQQNKKETALPATSSSELSSQSTIAADDDDSTLACQPYRHNAREAFVAISGQKRIDFEQLFNVIKEIPAEELNKYDEQGQTLAHKLTPVHWNPELISLAIALNVDLTLQTKGQPVELFTGSTLAHNIAGILTTRVRTNLKKRTQGSHNQFSEHNKKSLFCLFQLWQIDKGEHFNTLRLDYNKSYVTVWQMLEKSNCLDDFIKQLPNHNNAVANLAQAQPAVSSDTQARNKNHCATFPEELHQLKTRNEFVAASKKTIVNTKELLDLMEKIPQQEFNIYDQTGQTFSHKLCPVHRCPELILLAINLGVDFTMKSTSPDSFPGSTLAHNLAGSLRRRSSKKDDYVEYNPKTLHCLYQLWKIDKGRHFNQASLRSRLQSQSTVWELLDESGYLYEFLDKLENQFAEVPQKYVELYANHVKSKQ